MAKAVVVSESHQRESTEASVPAGWAWLPRELLELIIDRLILVSDHIEFGAVCKHWQSAAEQHKHEWRKLCHNKQLPMLMQITRNRKSRTNAALFSVSEGGMLRQLSWLPYYNKNIIKPKVFSTHGWLAYIDKLVLTLLNPFTGDTITLPPIIQPTHSLPDNSPHIYRVALSADPCLNPNAFEVLVTFSSHNARYSCLAHYNSADATWTRIDRDRSSLNRDAVYYKGQFVVLTSQDISFASSYIRGVTIPYQQYPLGQGMRYIVESSAGELLLVAVKEFGTFVPDVESVHVYNLLDVAGMSRPEWVEIESIGTDVLFLSEKEAICVSALEFPQCHPNSIYFTHGVYCLENRTTEKHDCLKKRRGERKTLLSWI